MAWPDDQELPVEVWAAFGADLTADPGAWSWTDLSSRLRAEPIRLRAGKSGGAGQVSPGTCTVTLVNDDGALTPLHPMSPYWPDVELGTPLRVSLRRVEDAFGRTSTSGWGTADSGQVWEGYGAGGTTAATDFSMSGGMARHSVPVAGAYRTSWLPDLRLRDCRVHLSGVALLVDDLIGGSIEPGNILLRAQDWGSYYLARVEITTGEAVLCKLYDPAGVLLASATVPGLTHTASQTLEVVAEITGSTLSMKVWATGSPEPAGWAVTATDGTLTAPGGIGVRTGVAGGNTNTKPITVSYQSITVWVDRFSGHADQWEPTYLPTGVVGEMASAVRVTCSGILRRLGQGLAPLQSPLRRHLAASNPIAYWPLEDGADSTQAASGLVGGTPMTVARDIMDFVDEGPAGSDGAAMPAVTADNQLAASIVGGSASAWQMSIWTRGVYTTSPAAYIPMEVRTTTGKILRFARQVVGTPELFLQYDTEEQSTTDNQIGYDPGSDMDDQWHLMQATLTQAGADVVVRFYFDGSLRGTETWLGLTIGAPVSVRAIGRFGGQGSVSQGMGEISITHPAVHNGATVVDQYQAGLGYPGEPAGVRAQRVCADKGVPVSIVGDPAETTPMGPQRSATLLELLRECEDADLGVLYEQGFGLGYRTRSARYDRPVDLTVDLAEYKVTGGSGDVLKPVYDDQDMHNELTVSRSDGSSVVVADEGSQRRHGTYADSVELNLASDDQLVDQAAWRLHLGAVEDLREQTFPIDVAANPELVDGWLSCQVGARIVRTNPPAQYRPGDLDRLVEGWTETIGPRSWQVHVVPSPAQPWDVATADGDQRVPADGSTLAAALTDTGMTLSLASTAENGVWTTDPAQFPQDLGVGGERVTASGISGTGSPQTVALSARGVNGVQRAWPAGTEVDVWEPAIAPL